MSTDNFNTLFPLFTSSSLMDPSSSIQQCDNFQSQADNRQEDDGLLLATIFLHF